MRRRAQAAGILMVLFALPTLASAQGRAGGATEEEETFQAAEAAFKDSRDDEALRLYEKVNGLNPQRADAWTKRGVILYKRRQYAEAVTLLTRARETLPDDPQVAGQLGLSLYKAGKTEAAVALLEAAVAKLPDAFQLQLQLGQHYVKVGDGKKAVGAFESYFRTRPEGAAGADLQVKAFSGMAYLLNKQYAEAERDLEAVVQKNPRDGAARVSLGAVYTARGEWDKCIATYRRVVSEAARQPLIWFNLGTCQYHLNQRAEAEKNALAYAEARPQEARASLLLGDVRAEKREYGKALEAWANARQAEPGNMAMLSQVASREGRVFLVLKQYAKARDAFEEAAKTRGDDTEVLLGLAASYVATQQPRAKLLALGERLSRLGDPAASLQAGECFYAADDDARALKEFEVAAAADPKAYHPRAGLRLSLNRLAGAALAKGDLAGAAALLNRAQKIDPESVVTNRNLGILYLVEGKFVEAEVPLRAALARVEHDLVVNRLLGRALLGQKRTDEAIPFYEAAVQAGQKIHGSALAEVLAELGPIYLEANRFDLAVLYLENAVKEAGSAPIAATASRNLAIALLRRGLDRLDEAPQAQASLDDITRAAGARAALAPKEAAAVSCALALATLKVGKPQGAVEVLARVQKEGGCQFKAPFDKLGQEFFPAYAAYREPNPLRREQAAKAFQKIQPKATGPLVEQLKELTRSSYELEGVDYYVRGDRKRSSVALKNAVRIAARSEHRELDHNLAVLDLDEGKVVGAGKVFEGLGSKPPEALVNLGIVRDREGESKKALDLYKRAVERGAHAQHLREWIDVKERVFARVVGGAK